MSQTTYCKSESKVPKEVSKSIKVPKHRLQKWVSYSPYNLQSTSSASTDVSLYSPQHQKVRYPKVPPNSPRIPKYEVPEVPPNTPKSKKKSVPLAFPDPQKITLYQQSTVIFVKPVSESSGSDEN